MNKISVFNVRLGLATNSSSTHSIVFFPKNSTVRDSGNVDDYGWQRFVLLKEKSKAEYLSALIRDNIATHCGNDIAQLVCQGLTGIQTEKYIDHQSLFTLPTDWENKGLDVSFAKEFSQFLSRDDVAILGGNDNDDSKEYWNQFPHQVWDNKLKNFWGKDTVARKDELGNYWTIFNRTTGAKVRMSFTPDAPPPHISSAPELIDLKITDWCDYGCKFCYQNSTTKGIHGVVDSDILSTLRSLKVFEVAIGGGEPTKHPNFVEILQKIRNQGVVPNFTTRNLEWLQQDEKTRESILNFCGAFAYSAHNATEAENFGQIVSKLENAKKANVQYVLGQNTREDFLKILKVCSDYHLRLTLLGFKTTGRGEKFPQVPYGWWLEEVINFKKNNWVMVGIDTALAYEYKAQLEAANIDESLFSTIEGTFSMYVDLVDKKIGPSSYHNGLLRKVKEFTPKTVLETYQSLSSAMLRTV